MGVTATVGAEAATCTDVEILFARGTGEQQGLGVIGGPFVSSLVTALPGRTVSSYAVVYAANSSQSSAGPGSTDLTNHLVEVAAECPDTVFVLGGYSQGATVVDKAIGIRTGSGEATVIPADLAPRVAAVVAFGNPLGLSRQTIASASPTYGARSRDYCNSGDPVCGAGFDFAAHLTYASNGSTDQGAAFAAGMVIAGGSPAPPTPVPTTPPTPTTPAPTTPAPTTTPATTSTPAPTTTPAPTSQVCITDDNRSHVKAGRASSWFGWAVARGSGNLLGWTSSFVSTSLAQDGHNTWRRVAGC